MVGKRKPPKAPEGYQFGGPIGGSRVTGFGRHVSHPGYPATRAKPGTGMLRASRPFRIKPLIGPGLRSYAKGGAIED
jgi:hypothetical protein